MPRGRRRSDLAKRQLPDSLTRHLVDPRSKVAKTPDGRRRLRRRSGAAEGLVVSAAALVIIALAIGHVLHAW